MYRIFQNSNAFSELKDRDKVLYIDCVYICIYPEPQHIQERLQQNIVCGTHCFSMITVYQSFNENSMAVDVTNFSPCNAAQKCNMQLSKVRMENGAYER